MASKLSITQLERVASLFRAFSEVTRLAILQELKQGELSVNDLTTRLSCTQANISRQLKILHSEGIVARRKEGTQVFHRIEDPMIQELCAIACNKLNRDSTKPAKLVF